MDKINCIIVDDTYSDMMLLEHYILSSPILNLIQKFNNSLEAFSFLKVNQPALIFLDVDMPLINGFDLFKQLTYSPICIFVTSHSEYAVASYEAQAFDFILKPVLENRFNQVIKRVHEYFCIKNKVEIFESNFEKETIIIKEGNTLFKVSIHEILYVEALKDYCKIVTQQKNYLALNTFTKFIEQLPTKDFVRIHRSYAVAKNKVQRLDKDDVFINGIYLPLGKTFKTEAKNIFGKN